MGGSTLERHIEHRVTLDLPAAADAPAGARQALDAIEHGLDREVEYTVKLLISELVSNSVKHCGVGSVQVEIEATARGVRVDVIDVGPAFVPGPRTAEPEAEGGWGLVLVNELATRWGSFDQNAHVWFEIDLANYANIA
jgi:anti-sigma regulatory factor (Ser/Thr protein kinase)